MSPGQGQWPWSAFSDHLCVSGATELPRGVMLETPHAALCLPHTAPTLWLSNTSVLTPAGVSVHSASFSHSLKEDIWQDLVLCPLPFLSSLHSSIETSPRHAFYSHLAVDSRLPVSRVTFLPSAGPTSEAAAMGERAAGRALAASRLQLALPPQGQSLSARLLTCKRAAAESTMVLLLSAHLDVPSPQTQNA